MRLGWLNGLQGLGCEYRMTASYQEACTLLETRRFDVVLSETELPDGNAYGLISTVTASPTNLFFCLAEDSYWWLPAVTQGRECLGAPGLRPGEFARRLQEILCELTAVVPSPPIPSQMGERSVKKRAFCERAGEAPEASLHPP